MCVGLAHLGAHGQTQEEIAHVLGYGPDFDTKNMSNILQRLHDQNNALQIANKVYVKSGYSLNQKYEKGVTEDLKSEVESLDFNQNEEAAKTVNDWIEDHTNHKIKNMVQSSMLGSDTRLLLVNAVYFKAAWKIQFNQGSTQDFTNSDGSTTKTELMFNEDDFHVAHFENLASHIVKMNYHDTNIAMYVVIPDETQGLTKVEQNLAQLNFKEIGAQLTRSYIKLFMPKFEFEHETGLNEILKKMGMATAFTDTADFSGILEKNDLPLKISDAIHKAFIKVDEKGTEAGAATGLILRFNYKGNVTISDFFSYSYRSDVIEIS